MIKPLSITELTLQIKNKIESAFFSVCVEGEITNFKEQTSGHLYFNLKDENAQLACVLFKGNARNLEKLPKSGDQVVVKGELSVYAPRGSYQLIIRELAYSGTGELLLKFHQLKNKLQDLGWFLPQHKKPLPQIPKRIGIVTSPTGAVIQDMIQILKRRFPGFKILLNPVKVQGEGAAEEITQAIYDFNRYQLVDVIIVGRGGGSFEDLWAFNEEKVAAAIFHSQSPVISAVGHETDVSIADFVASVRAPTPSAAAELVIAEKAHLLRQLEKIKKNPLLNQPYTLLKQHHQKIDDTYSFLKKTLLALIREKHIHLNNLKKRVIASKPTQKLFQRRAELRSLKKNLDQIILKKVTMKKEITHKLIAHLKALDPKNLLKKGYALAFHKKNGSIIMGVKEVEKSESIKILFFDGEASADIKTVTLYE